MHSDSIYQFATLTMRRGALPAMLVFAAHVVASIFDAYTRFPLLDLPMHFFGGLVIAYFFHRASITGSACRILGPFHPLTHAILVFALTCTATVFWEFAEFISDRFFGTHAQQGLADTLFDMLLGIVGGITMLGAALSVGATAKRD